MAINTTGSNGSVVGVTGVHPDNIGKGIKWNDTIKKYEIAVSGEGIYINDKGELDLKLKDSADNGIRVIDGGLYQGNVARPELSILYVDAVNGVDQDPRVVSGAGTRSKPLKTFTYACSLAEQNTTRTICLKEDQDHVVLLTDDLSNFFTVKSGYLVTMPYGDKFDQLRTHWSGNMILVANELLAANKEPRLVFKGVAKVPYKDPIRDFDRIRLTLGSVMANAHWSMTGIRLVNDLGFSFSLRVASDNIGSSSKQPYRVDINDGGLVSMNRCRLATRGTPNVTGTVTFPRSDFNLIEDFQKRGSKGLWHSSFFHGSGLDLQLSSVIGLDTTECYVIGCNGWDSVMGTRATLASLGGTNNDELTKRVFGFVYENQTPSGDLVIIVPKSNIKTSHWAKQI